MARASTASMRAHHCKDATGRVASIFRHGAGVLLLAGLLLSPVHSSAAQDIDLTLVPSSLTGIPGSTVIFSGRITNTSGTVLQAFELFLNFGNYDPTIFTDIEQILGTTDFTLPNNTFSAVVPLFSVMVSSTAPAGDYGFEVSVGGPNDILSDVRAGDVLVQSPVVTTPEPSTAVLLGAGMFAIGGVRVSRRRRARGTASTPTLSI